MNSLLTEILREKQKEVDTLKKAGLPIDGGRNEAFIRDFKTAISVPDRINLIAEIKFASPSAGTIRETGDPLTIARKYEAAGAAAISLLTDRKFFRGDIKHLPRLREAVSLPILRKDFIIDDIQVRESFFWGADAILLIARILSKQQLKRLLETCRGLGLAALTEIHDRQDLYKALACDADILGINNRNLDSFDVNLRTSMELAPLVPKGTIVVSESGIKKREDVQFLKRTGIQSMLVGTSIMTSHDMEEKTRALVEAGCSL